MGLFKRVNNVIVAQLSEIVETFENPESLLKQAIREMETAVQNSAESTARAIAVERRLRRELTTARDQQASWQKRAVQLLQGGQEAAARQALARKIENEALSANLAEQLEKAEATSGNLRQQLESMRRRLDDARRQLTSLVARKRSAAALKQFADALGQFESDVDAFHRFDELARRVTDAETESEVLAELSGIRNPLDERTTEVDVEVEFEALKKVCAKSVAAPAVENAGASP